MNHQRQEIVSYAGYEVGVKEAGHNAGARVETYLSMVGLDKGNAWCMAFVYFILRKAGVDFIKTGSCSAAYEWAKANNRLTDKPQPGDVFLLRGGNTGHKHTGIVTNVQGTYVNTIEGNTNDDGSAEGDGVYRRTRKMTGLDFIRTVDGV